MKELSMLLGAVALAGAVPGAAHAVTTVTFGGGSGTLPNGTVVFQNFDAFAPGASLGTNAQVFGNSVAGQAARPAFGSTANFGATLTNGLYAVNFGPTNLFSFILGSLDSYNSLTLRYEDGTSQVYAGGQIINDLTFPSGNQISGETNGVVTYRVTSGPRLIGATFASTGNSFEFDNLAISAVPEPGTWGIMLGGFGLIGLATRRRMRTVRLSA